MSEEIMKMTVRELLDKATGAGSKTIAVWSGEGVGVVVTSDKDVFLAANITLALIHNEASSGHSYEEATAATPEDALDIVAREGGIDIPDELKRILREEPPDEVIM